MPYQIKLLQATEAGSWNASQNKITLPIPSDISVCDLSMSDIALDVVCTVAATGADLGLYDVQLADGYDPRCLIRTAKLSTVKGGDVEEIQNQNVMNMNFKAYNQNIAQQSSYTWRAEGSPNVNVGSFLHKYHVGDRQSVQRSFLTIPLSTMYGVGQSKQWLNGLYDGTDIELYLEYDDAIVSKLFQQVTLPATACDALAIGETSDVVLTAPAPTQTGIPWFVGQEVTVTATPTITAVEATNCSIANPCVITVAESLADLGLQDGVTVTIAGAAGGGWAGMNGNLVISNATANTFSVAFDASGQGAQPTTYPTIVLEASEQPTDVVTETIIDTIAVSAANIITLSLDQTVGWALFAATNVSVKGTASAHADTALSY
jgi:hypothetical protein